MKKAGAILCALLLVFGVVGVASATLWDRGGGLIYDDVLNITWLQDADYARTSGYDLDGYMNWNQAMAWADQLVYGGYDDWRLPDAHNQDGSESGYGTATESEMGHMFYNNLGGISGSFPGADFIDGNGDSVVFQNLPWPFSYNPGGLSYWSGTEYAAYPVMAWFYVLSEGFAYRANKDTILLYAWAVRDGDVGSAPVPEPATMLLLASGLVGLAGFRKRFGKS